MGAPQIIWVVLAVISLCCSAFLHGHERLGTHSFPVDFVGRLLTFALLYWGGFFGG